MDKYFYLTVKSGSVVHRASGIRQTLIEVPKNALELWEEGSQTLCLRKDGLELLTDFSKARLEKVLDARKHLNYKTEIKLLEDAIKASGKSKKPEAAEK